MCTDLLSSERLKLARYSSDGRLLNYSDRRDFAIDHMESARDFLQSIEEFVCRKAHEMSAIRTKMGLPDGLDKQNLALWNYNGSQLQSKAPSFPIRANTNQSK